MRILVVGARGFVGRATCAALASRGHQVRAMGRGPLPLGFPPVDQSVVGDPQRVGEWFPLIEGCDAVVYLAARVHASASENAESLALYRAANVHGPVDAARAAAMRGVKSFVYASSVKVHGESASIDAPVRADTPMRPLGAYSLSKAEGELALASELSGSSTALGIVVLPLVYGPHVRANFLRLIRLTLAGSRIPLPFASIHNARSFSYIENAVDVVVRVAERNARGRYMVDDGKPVSTPDLIRAIAASLRIRTHLVRCRPEWLAAAARAVGRGPAAERLLGSLVVDSSETRRALGWKPRWSMAEGLLETVAWYRSESGSA
ncbi:MAG: NAD-dependent epimerase/dehydratase family protein [Gemmatimonadaceae bacterium]